MTVCDNKFDGTIAVRCAPGQRDSRCSPRHLARPHPPTNAAFAAIPGGAPTNVTTLGNVLRLYVVGARALSPSPSDNQTLASLLGPSLTIGISGTTITVRGPTNTSTVGPADIVAQNGVIHVVNTVLLL